MKSFADKRTRLLLVLSGLFICNALVAEFIGVKIFQLETSLGFDPVEFNFTGQVTSLQLTCGVLLWPFVFVLTDIINEYFGEKGVRYLSVLTAGLIAYAFVMVSIAIHTNPAPFWEGQAADQGMSSMNAAFQSVFGQSNWIIIGSLVAFLVGQILDAYVFHRIKAATGDRAIWLRATVSTLVSQLVDSFVVLYIAFVLGPQQWSMSLFVAVALTNYIYKFVVALLMTPVIYVAHNRIDRWLAQPAA